MRRVNEAFAGRASCNLMYYYSYDLSAEPPQAYYDTLWEDFLQTVDRLAQTVISPIWPGKIFISCMAACCS